MCLKTYCLFWKLSHPGVAQMRKEAFWEALGGFWIVLKTDRQYPDLPISYMCHCPSSQVFVEMYCNSRS